MGNEPERKLTSPPSLEAISCTDLFLSFSETARWTRVIFLIRAPFLRLRGTNSEALQEDPSKKTVCFSSATTRDFGSAWGSAMSPLSPTTRRVQVSCRMLQAHTLKFPI